MADKDEKKKEEEKESEVVQAIKADYEKKLEEQKKLYEEKIAEIKADNKKTIEVLLSTGAKYKEDGQQEKPKEENEDDTILSNVRKKFKLEK